MKFDVAVLGFGIVGSGTVEVISKNSDKIAQSAGCEIRVKYIVDVQDFPDSPFKNLLVKDFAVVENDPDVKVVVESIGGVGVALDFTRRSLTAGKSVVTSNKELVAKHGYELLRLAEEHGVNYLFEASVGGGIPIIRPLTQCLAANRIFEIYGILNGTTNYILTEMINSGRSFEDALDSARKNGYAEQNPSNDIEGHDACRKISILSALCYGRHIYPDWVPTEGILGITASDTELASRLGYKIKLLGRALETDGGVSAYVAPHLVSGTNLLSGVEGVMNGIVVRGNAIGDVMFYGAGAGKMPTASAIVADVIDAARHVHARRNIGWSDGDKSVMRDPAELETAWFIRTGASRSEVPEALITKCAEEGWETAFITPVMSRARVLEALGAVPALSLIRVLE